jgi:hypothetical protein
MLEEQILSAPCEERLTECRLIRLIQINADLANFPKNAKLSTCLDGNTPWIRIE